MRGKQWDLSNGTKPCPKCGEIKPLNAFGSNKYAKTGLSVYCKACAAAEARARRATPEGKTAHYQSTLKWINGLPDNELANGEKTCPKCEIKKPFAEYPKNRRNKHGIGTYCLICSANVVRARRAVPEGAQAHRDASKRWREANLERHKDNNARWRYGVEHGTYNTLFAQQNGKCAICETTENGTRLAIDHCHATGKIRGLLCDTCNKGLGRFKDRADLLASAIKYLSERGSES